jgi:hypothetical protein
MVEVHLYGKLRSYSQGSCNGSDCVLMLEPRAGETVSSLLAHHGIPAEEVNHIFLNAKLLATRNSMGAFYGYPQAGSSISDWELTTPVNSGDRIGLFGRDMAILGM